MISEVKRKRNLGFQREVKKNLNKEYYNLKFFGKIESVREMLARIDKFLFVNEDFEEIS